jgi:uroporphyrinogen decarboxylase
MNSMTSKERVHAALRREPVDRVPVYMWYHPETTSQLAELLEIVPERVVDAMGDDVRQKWVGGNYAMEGIVHEQEGDSHRDYWGIEWVKIGYFNQIKKHPLRRAAREDIFRYQYPYDKIESLLQQMAPIIPLAETYFIGCDVSPCAFEMVYRLCGMDEALLNMAADPELSTRMLKDACTFALALAEIACERFPIDWLWTGDDVAGQETMMMSPQHWREQIGPHLAKVMAAGKKKGIWVAHHCCGATRPVIADLIDMGVDVLNPVQGNCPGMDPVELKAEYGTELAFMGGIDTQELLPKGSVSDVRRETEFLLEKMTADGGGYILAASHTIPHETPLENVFAVYEAAGVSRDEIFDRAADIRNNEQRT